MDNPDNGRMLSGSQSTNYAESKMPSGIGNFRSTLNIQSSSSSWSADSSGEDVETLGNVQIARPSSSVSSVSSEDGVKKQSTVTHGDLIQLILARLSAVNLTRSRLVCHEWDSFIYDRPSRRVKIESWAIHKPFERWILFTDYSRNLAFYDIVEGKWRTYSMSLTHGFIAPTSARGLMFMYGFMAPGGVIITAWNPLTGRKRLLPPLVHSDRKIMVLSVDALEVEGDKSLSYALVVTGYISTDVGHPVKYIVEIYESSSNSWRSAENPPPLRINRTLHKRFVERFRYSDNNFLLVDRSSHEPGYFHLDAENIFLDKCSIDTAVFTSNSLHSNIQFREDPDSDVKLRPLFLFERDGRLVLLVIELNTSRNCRTCGFLKIWTRSTVDVPLQGESLPWTVISTMPGYILDKLHIRGETHATSKTDVEDQNSFCSYIHGLKCFAVGGEVPDDDQIIFITRLSCRIYSFKFKEPLSQKSWKRMDKGEKGWKSHHSTEDNEYADHRADASTRGIVTKVLNYRGSEGFCFTPRPDVVA